MTEKQKYLDYYWNTLYKEENKQKIWRLEVKAKGYLKAGESLYMRAMKFTPEGEQIVYQLLKQILPELPNAT